MSARRLQGDAQRVSYLLAGVALAAGAASGYLLVGAALAAGLVAGSFNSFFMWSLLERRAPILPTSFLRLAFFTVLALVAARLLGASVWAVAAGIAAAQLVMVGTGIRHGLRA